MMHYAGSSHLLGAFLGGLMFCTDHTVHHAWTNQIKRILHWMLRIFFAATIGFEVPIQEFDNWTVISGGLIYFTAIIGKIATGLLSGKPLKTESFLTVAFSMSAWGEFAFILATTSFSMGNINKDSFASVLMAVLLSVIISPFLLRRSLIWANNKKQRQLTKVRRKTIVLEGINGAKNAMLQNAYYLLHTRARARWGHQDKLLRVLSELKLEVIDFRAWHSAHSAKHHHKPDVHNVFYVQVMYIFYILYRFNLYHFYI